MSRNDPRATCKTCAFWDQDTTESEKDTGACSIRAPLAGGGESWWPYTRINNWCGEHEYAKSLPEEPSGD